MSHFPLFEKAGFTPYLEVQKNQPRIRLVFDSQWSYVWGEFTIGFDYYTENWFIEKAIFGLDTLRWELSPWVAPSTTDFPNLALLLYKIKKALNSVERALGSVIELFESCGGNVVDCVWNSSYAIRPYGDDFEILI